MRSITLALVSLAGTFRVSDKINIGETPGPHTARRICLRGDELFISDDDLPEQDGNLDVLSIMPIDGPDAAKYFVVNLQDEVANIEVADKTLKDVVATTLAWYKATSLQQQRGAITATPAVLDMLEGYKAFVVKVDVEKIEAIKALPDSMSFAPIDGEFVAVQNGDKLFTVELGEVTAWFDQFLEGSEVSIETVAASAILDLDEPVFLTRTNGAGRLFAISATGTIGYRVGDKQGACELQLIGKTPLMMVPATTPLRYAYIGRAAGAITHVDIDLDSEGLPSEFDSLVDDLVGPVEAVTRAAPAS
jgi:hypothetical protein